MKTMTVGLAVSGLALASLLSFSTSARAEEASSLRLEMAEQTQHGRSWLLGPDSTADLPDSMQHAMLGQIGDEMSQNLASFSHSLTDEATAGGGDGGGAIVFLAGLLGFFPGFGLGHLVTGHIGGFVLWLCIDLVLAGIFFGVFPVLAFAFWYVPGIIVYVGERIVEAVFAANAAMSPVIVEATPPHDGPAPVQAAIPVLSF